MPGSRPLSLVKKVLGWVSQHGGLYCLRMPFISGLRSESGGCLVVGVREPHPADGNHVWSRQSSWIVLFNLVRSLAITLDFRVAIMKSQ